MPKPFLLLTSRPNGNVLASEIADLPRFCGLSVGQWQQIRLEGPQLPSIHCKDWSGAIICGSPWDASADPSSKSAEQIRGEKWLTRFYDQALAENFPLLGRTLHGAHLADSERVNVAFTNDGFKPR